MTSNQRIDSAAKMVINVLEGKISEETHPHVFADDLLYLNVRILEEQRADWLFERLGATDYTAERRELVAAHLSPKGQARAAL
jgi:hypothetical protein